MVQIRRQTDEAKGAPAIGRRVGGEIETVGVAPVPDDQRVQTPRQMFIVWLMASASATTPLIGALLFKFGLTDMIIAIVAAWVIGFIPAGLYVPRRRTPAAVFFVPPRRLADRVVPSAIVAVAIGFVLGFWGDRFLPGFFYNTLPLPVVAGLAAAALYGLAAALWPPPQTPVPASAAASGSAAAR